LDSHGSGLPLTMACWWVWFQSGPPGTEPGQKKAQYFQVGSWRKDEWKPHGEPRKKLTHQFWGGGGRGEWGILLRVSVTFVRQDSTAFIRFGE